MAATVNGEAPEASRNIARALVYGLVALFALQLVQVSIFNTVQRAPPALDAAGHVDVASSSQQAGPTTFDFVNLAAHLTIVGSALAFAWSRRRLQPYRVAIGVTLVYGVSIAVSSFTMQALLIPLTIVSLAACVPALFLDADYDRLLQGVLGLLVIAAVSSLWLVVTQQSSLFGYELMRVDGRGGTLVAVGLFAHRNIIGAIVQFGPALALYLMSRAERRLRPWYLAAFVLIVAHVFLTFSRSSQIVALVSLLPWLWGARRRLRASVAFLAFAGVAAFLVLAAIPEFRGYVGLGTSLSSRPEIWRGFWRLVLQRPWFGHGLRNVEYVAHGARYGPHSAYLAQLAFFGVVGLVLFLVVLVAFGRQIARALPAHSGPSSWAIVMLVAGVLLQAAVEYFVATPVMLTNSLFWVCAGLASRPRGAGTY